MGQRGPPKTPTEILKTRGSWRGKVRNDPKAELKKPKKPKWLNAEAGAAWDQLTEQLEKMGVLAITDKLALARYCATWARWRKAQMFIETHGEALMVQDEEKVKWKRYPASRIANELAVLLLKLEQQFGLTPAARANLNMDFEEKKGDDEGLLRFA